jgi:glutamyl-Q tRNA(Asp) synthetase
MSEVVTRFAPSPNGNLHLGHAYSAIQAHDRARLDGGRFLLRIEDIDGARSRSELAEVMRTDLAWLGLEWEEVTPQSRRTASYEQAADRLREAGLLYPCRCTRSQIHNAAEGVGPDGPIYPGTCKGADIASGERVSWRLDVATALHWTGALFWTDEPAGVQLARPDLAGDPVLVRKDPDTPASYHLAATLDDAADGVTVVTRGLDLFSASHLHRLLQELLGLPVPIWHHHALLFDEDGRKLAKRRNSPWLAQMRANGEDGRKLADALRKGRSPAGITISRSLHPLA